MIDAATRAAAAAQSAERACAEAVRDLEQQLDDAHDRLAGAKRTSRAAAAALRDARRALDRLQRAPVSR
jgi:outer membrane protein TolC